MNTREQKFDENLMMKIITTIPYFMHKVAHTLPKQEKPGTLNRTQHRTLWLIYHEGKKCMGSLAEHLNIEKGSFTSVVDTLIDKGMVEKTRDTEDRRKTLIQLTLKGKKLVEDHLSLVSRAVSQKLQALKDDEYRKFIRAINDLHEVIMKL